MAQPITHRMIVRDHVKTKLKEVNGPTLHEWYSDFTRGEDPSLAIKSQVLGIEQIAVDMCPYVAVFVTRSNPILGMGGRIDYEIEILTWIVTKEDVTRFGAYSALDLLEYAIADAQKAIFSAAKEPTVGAICQPNPEVLIDSDEELGRWASAEIYTRWTVLCATRGL
jgi:hypothetical protein